MRPSLARLAFALLLACLALRAANSAWCLLGSSFWPSRLDRLWAGDDQRLTDTFVVPDAAGHRSDRFLRQLQLLRTYVGARDKAYYLHEFTGDYTVIRMFRRIRWVLYPRFLQPVRRLPVPDSPAGRTRDGVTWVLDCRRAPAAMPAGFERVAAVDGATLWRLGEAGK